MDEETRDPPEDDGDAAQAFEALREEVPALRRGVELIYRQGQQTSPAVTGAPDYSLTLDKMEKALQTIAGRLEAVERQPALSLTPGSFRKEIAPIALFLNGLTLSISVWIDIIVEGWENNAGCRQKKPTKY